MRKRINYIIIFLVTVMGFGVCASEYKNHSLLSAVTSAPPSKTKPVTAVEQQETKSEKPNIILSGCTNPISVVNNPNSYLNKKITVSARFDKFSTLGLDYKPAYKSSEDYISFLIMRSDTDKNIPLSEMKLFIKRASAEKFVDLKEGDRIKFTGTVFSTALGDPWIEVESFDKLK